MGAANNRLPPASKGNSQQAQQKQAPVHSIRHGRLQGSIWQNASDNGPWYSITLTRSYQKDGKWASATSYGRDDLLALSKLVEVLYMWTVENPASKQENGNSNGHHHHNDDDPPPY
jgi:hypothetical protein